MHMTLSSRTLASVAYIATLTASTLLAQPALAQEAEPHVHYINGPRKDAPTCAAFAAFGIAWTGSAGTRVMRG